MSATEFLMACGVSQGQHGAMVGLCHHCGLPLCERHVYYVRDPHFAALDDVPPVYALHCEQCAIDNHRLLGRTTTRPAVDDGSAARASGA